MTVAELVASLPKAAWVRHRVTEGARGPREYRFACLRVVERRHGKPGPWSWLIARRPVVPKPGEEVKYYLSNAPEEIGLKELAWVACLRWTIEEDFETSKGEVGLDHYEVTKHRGWYHHTALVLMALAFLRLTQHAWAGEKSGSRRQRAGDPGAVRGGAASAGVVADHRDRLVPGPATPQAGGAGQPQPALAA